MFSIPSPAVPAAPAAVAPAGLAAAVTDAALPGAQNSVDSSGSSAFAEKIKKAIESGSMKTVAADIAKRFTSPFQTPTTSAPLGTGTAQGTSSSAASSETAAETAAEFLQVLLLCKGVDYAVGELKIDETPEQKEFHGAIAAIAGSASLSVIKHIKEHIAASVLKGSGELARVFTSTTAGRSSDAHHLLLAAQCLYLLTRHFQMDSKLLKETLDTAADLLRVVQQDRMWRGMSISAFRQARGTAAYSALTWLVVFSVSNATAPWQKKRDNHGALQSNSLVKASTSCFTDFFNGFSEELQSTAASPVVCGYWSILLLSYGCLLKGKGEEEGYDKALEAMVGCHEGLQSSRGKATKRMVQLAPPYYLLSMPIEKIYIGPYETLCFLFDEMLPLLRHVSELELAALKDHLDQLQAYEELPGGGTAEAAARHRGEALEGGDLWWGAGKRNCTTEAIRCLTPFTSEMAHILEALKVCLGELPPRYLDPDLDSDCAATWFIFRNCVKHLSQALLMVKGTANCFMWENYAYKLVSRFIDVLTMIGRHHHYIERVAHVLESAQSECPDIQWGNLLQQALACVGFYPSGCEPLPKSPIDRLGTSSLQGRPEASLSTVPLLFKIHPQFTEEYSRKTQQNFVTSFFMLLRQLLSHPGLQHVVKGYLSLPVALSFLFAPQQSPSTLGSTLSLVSSLITSAEDATVVWDFLEIHQLLGTTDVKSVTLPRGTSWKTEKETHKNLSLMGHCRYECSQGSYRITIGFLNLVIALFRYDIPPETRAPLYTAIAHFVAQEVFCGVSRRSFGEKRERYTVMALAAAALRQSLLVRFNNKLTNTTTVVPFTTIMATNIAPTDVIGEVQEAIEHILSSSTEILSHQRAAIRQCLHLLNAAVQAAIDQKLRIFSLSARTTQDSSLASKLLVLASSSDLLLAKASLQLLFCFPMDVVAEASRYWHVDNGRLALVQKAFTAMLHPMSVLPSTAEVEPELAMLDGLLEGNEKGNDTMILEVKSLMLDLLIVHAAATEQSITAWLCGFHSNTTSLILKRQDGTVLMTPLLEAVVLGAMSSVIEREHPNLSVKYVKLLYVLRSSRLYGGGPVRSFIETHCQPLFLSLLYLQPTSCDPLLLSKYAFIIKMLALELCYAHQHTPNQLSMSGNTLPSLLVEVSLSLCHAHSRTAGSISADPFQSSRSLLQEMSREESPDVTQWLHSVLHHLPVFPACPALPCGNDTYLVKATDSVVQYDIAAILGVKQEAQRNANLPPLSNSAMKEQLAVYIEANKCFLIYASTQNFLESLCQMISMACTTVEGVGTDRLLEFANCVLDGLSTTPSLTVDAQERISYRLCRTLTTIVAKLKLLEGSDSSAGEGRKTMERGAGKKSISGSSPFDTFASSISNQLHQFRRIPRCFSTREEGIGSHVSPSHSLLKPVVETLVQWGPKIPCIRLDLYNTLMLLSVIPGVRLDDTVVFRSQDALLQLLVGEICRPFNASTRYHSLALLIQLVQSSETICSTFCCSLNAQEGLGPLALKCFNALFVAVDLASYHTTINPNCDVPSVKQLIRSTFDLLSVLSVQHTCQILQGNLLMRCMSMDIWTRSSQIILAHAIDTSSSRGSPSVLSRGQDVVRTLFLLTMRWLNVMLAADGQSTLLVEQVQQFFCYRRPLVNFFLQSPNNRLESSRDVVFLTPLHVELSGLLRALASSHLASDCRCLAAELAIPQLLLSIVSGPLAHYASPAAWTATDNTSSQRDAVATHQQDEEEHQFDIIAAVLHNLSDFLLRCEYGARGNIAEAAKSEGTAGRKDGSENLLRLKSLLRHRPNDMECVFLTAEQLSRQLLQLCSGRGSAMPQRRLECLVFTLHSLVVLIQSFVLPLCSDDCDVCGSDFQAYLQSIDFARVPDVLKAAQQAAYSLQDFNGDFSNGLVGRRAAGGWEVTTQSSLSNAMLQKQQSNAPASTHRDTSVSHSEPPIPLAPREATVLAEDHRNVAQSPPSATAPCTLPQEHLLSGSKRRLAEYLPHPSPRVTLLTDNYSSADVPNGFRVGSAWTDVLSLDHSLRLLKIVIANTARAVKVGSSYSTMPPSVVQPVRTA